MTREVDSLRRAGVAIGAGLLIPLLVYRAPAPPLLREPVETPSPSATDDDPTATPLAEASPPTDTPTPTTEIAETFTDTPEASSTAAASDTPDASLTPEATETPTAAPTLPSAPAPNPEEPLSILINEIAWAGTAASANDEWVELHNPGSEPVDLSGWVLTDGNDVNVLLRGVLPAFGFYLLERTNDQTISDLTADQIYTGNLKNDGETLELISPRGEVIDRANGDGGK